jgi:hypothetical protein
MWKSYGISSAWYNITVTCEQSVWNVGPTLLQGECGETKTTNKVKQPCHWNLIHHGSSRVSRETLRSSFRPWRYRSLVTFHVATSSNPEPQVKSETLTYVQRPRLVRPSVRVLGKPSTKRGRAGSASDWQALEECACKHLKSSKERYEKALATKKLT